MSKTALIVDDSTSLRQMVSFTLREAGFEVLEGANGKEGLRQLSGQPLQVIITDLNMPEMDGIAMIQQIRTIPAYRFTPILMLTTESHAAKRDEARKAGATGWIVKPFVPEKLLDIVNRVAV